MSVSKDAQGLPASYQHLLSIETRIARLEDEVSKTRGELKEQGADLDMIIEDLPVSSIISPNFLSRAFAVWGHYFVAQLIIAIPIYCIIFLFITATSNH